MLDLAIIIVNYKSQSDTLACLASLKQDLAETAAFKYQLMVVDNTPTEGLGQELTRRWPDVVYLPQKRNRGFGAGENAGIMSQPARYYFVLNPDTLFPANEAVVSRLFNFMEKHPRVGLAAPKLLNYDGTLQFSCRRFHDLLTPLYRRTFFGNWLRNQKKLERFLMKNFDHNQTLPVDWVIGSAMFIRGLALEEAGLFDERFFMYFEDTDLCRRLWEARWPVYYVGEIKIKHHHGQASAAVPGVIASLYKNKLARTHLLSGLKYFWKWRFLKI